MVTRTEQMSADKVAEFSRKKDIDWKEALDTDHLKALAIAAFNKEFHSLTNTQEVLREVTFIEACNH
jgi:hypothetical protein